MLLIMINTMLFFVDDDKHLIKVLRKEKQYTARELLKEFSKMVLWWFKSTNLLLNTLPVVVDQGQRIMLKTSSLFVHSQENCPHSHCFVRQIACEAHIYNACLYITSSRKTCRWD